GVDIAYVCADAMDMPEALDESFDVVVSTNGFLPFVSDLGALFAGVERILVAGGSYLLFDTHPFIYPFAGYVDKVAVKKPYEATGPFAKGATYHWRVQDIVNSVVSSGLVLSALLELHALPGTFWDDLVDDEDKLQHAHDWRYNGLAALPQWIVVKAEKRREPCASHTFFDSANPESPSGFGSICERDDNE
ncbi:MAG: class I SAM-dependent methyltransferase, partial [Eggerthellaceae bacterium]|nr:class I SAM-dependent methyltransferase [Eggerthellaceae bacterium]